MFNIRNWTFLKHVLLSTVVIGLVFLSSSLLKYLLIERGSKSVVSGTDGPTAVIIATRFSVHQIFNMYTILFFILLVLYKPAKILIIKIFNY